MELQRKKKFKFKENKSWYYEQQFLGLNYRMTDVSASMGLSQLRKLKKFVRERNEIAKKYDRYLDKKYLYVPKIGKNTLSSFHLYVIKIKEKYQKYHQNLFNHLRKNKINVNLHYIPVHLHPYYRSLGFKRGDFRLSEKHSRSAISIPIFPGLKSRQILKISNLINNFFLNFEKKK